MSGWHHRYFCWSKDILLHDLTTLKSLENIKVNLHHSYFNLYDISYYSTMFWKKPKRITKASMYFSIPMKGRGWLCVEDSDVGRVLKGEGLLPQNLRARHVFTSKEGLVSRYNGVCLSTLHRCKVFINPPPPVMVRPGGLIITHLSLWYAPGGGLIITINALWLTPPCCG